MQCGDHRTPERPLCDMPPFCRTFSKPANIGIIAIAAIAMALMYFGFQQHAATQQNEAEFIKALTASGRTDREIKQLLYFRKCDDEQQKKIIRSDFIQALASRGVDSSDIINIMIAYDGKDVMKMRAAAVAQLQFRHEGSADELVRILQWVDRGKKSGLERIMERDFDAKEWIAEQKK